MVGGILSWWWDKREIGGRTKQNKKSEITVNTTLDKHVNNEIIDRGVYRPPRKGVMT